MKSSDSSTTAFSDSKVHYAILDGLRGVAAIVVVIFHLFETFSGGNHLKQIINHGYLAVDFFFLLSGFVIGYAYDDSWHKMTLKVFFKRRLIRLHPMIIIAMIIGAIGYYFSASPVLFPKIASTPFSQLFLTMLVGFTLLPVPPSMEIRGWGEMHPLNGPAWSLYFEYIANLVYAFILRRLSNKVLAILVFIAGAVLIHFAVTGPNGDVIGGWSLDWTQTRVGLTRLAYPFLAGLLLSRVSKPRKLNHAFLGCSLLLILMLAIPRIGGESDKWMNGLYDSLTIIFIFPLIVYMGASGQLKGAVSSRICKFLGDISYPIYIIHYPLIYIFTAWVVDHKVPMQEAWPQALLVLFASIAIAYACLKLYDIPVRRWLAKKWM